MPAHIFNSYERSIHSTPTSTSTVNSNSSLVSSRFLIKVVSILLVVFPHVVNARVITMSELEKIRRIEEVEDFLNTQMLLHTRLNSFSTLFKDRMKQEIINETFNLSKFLLISFFEYCLKKVQQNREARREAQRIAYKLAKKRMREAFLREKLYLGMTNLSAVLLIRGGFFATKRVMKGISKILKILFLTNKKSEDDEKNSKKLNFQTFFFLINDPTVIFLLTIILLFLIFILFRNQIYELLKFSVIQSAEFVAFNGLQKNPKKFTNVGWFKLLKYFLENNHSMII